MSGYRQHSFDPNAYERQGPPLRPFNWVQWTGVFFGACGLGVDVLYFGAKLGWFRPLLDSPASSTGLLLCGVVLINSRRQTIVDQAPELAAARRRWLIIVTAICVAILGAATILEFKGA